MNGQQAIADAAGIVMLGTDAPIIPVGRAWAKGEQGEPGEIGASAYELWLTECNSGEKADFFSDLGMSALATMYQSPPGTATDNANVYGFGMVRTSAFTLHSMPNGRQRSSCQHRDSG